MFLAGERVVTKQHAIVFADALPGATGTMSVRLPQGQGAVIGYHRGQTGPLYSGSFRDGVPAGHGKMIDVDQSRYVGEMDDGYKHGAGQLITPGRGDVGPYVVTNAAGVVLSQPPNTVMQGDWYLDMMRTGVRHTVAANPAWQLSWQLRDGLITHVQLIKKDPQGQETARIIIPKIPKSVLE